MQMSLYKNISETLDVAVMIIGDLMISVSLILYISMPHRKLVHTGLPVMMITYFCYILFTL